MFLSDKYGLYAEENVCYHDGSPGSDEALLFHQDAMKMMSQMAQDESIPHIICYGPEGSGKKTVLRRFLRMIYGPEVEKTKPTLYQVTGSGNNVTEVTIQQSNFHLVIEPNNDNRDRYLIHDVVKEYARRMPLHSLFSQNKAFKTVVINNLGNLSYSGQTSLRRTMEKYSDTCRFIMWSHSLSNVIEPLRSRCFCFRIVPPNQSDIRKLLYLVCGHEKIQIPLSQLIKIGKQAKGNLKIALWLLDMWVHGYDELGQYERIIQRAAQLIIQGKFSSLQPIRDMLYTLIISNIKGSKILISLMEELIEHHTRDYSLECQIVDQAVFYEHRLASARREIIHLDAFVIAVMKLFRQKIDHQKH